MIMVKRYDKFGSQKKIDKQLQLLYNTGTMTHLLFHTYLPNYITYTRTEFKIAVCHWPFSNQNWLLSTVLGVFSDNLIFYTLVSL